MESNAFVAEVYRRMTLRLKESGEVAIPWNDFMQDPSAVVALHEYQSVLPKDKNCKILDIGVGSGWFVSACLQLGYTNLYAADFGATEKFSDICKHTSAIKSVFDIENNIADFLSGSDETYDFIHMSHVIEHIPKYSLLFVTDALYKSLRQNGTLLLRTPNMEGPCALSSLYVTLGHEYGFTGSNLMSLLSICGFDDVALHEFPPYCPSLKQKIGALIRRPFILANKLMHRLFGVNSGGQFGKEVIISGSRGNFAPLFDEKYR